MSARQMGLLALVAWAACFSPAAPSGATAGRGAVVGGAGGSVEPELVGGAGGSAGGAGQEGGAAPRPRVCSSDVDTECALVEGVEAGGTFTCVELDDGTLRCFGNNDSGQLGDPSQPVNFFGVGTVAPWSPGAGLVLGRAHACAVGEGGLRCWGRNLVGQLGTGDRVFRHEPMAPVVLEGPVSEAATEHSATCALVEGRVWCWGHALNGQAWLSDDFGEALDVPSLVPGVHDARSIAVGTLFACAVRGDEEVWCWGHGGEGQLGRGDTQSDATPAPVVGLPTPVHRLVGGGAFGCALAGAPSELWCWGRMDGDIVPTPTSRASLPAAEVVDLQAGDRSACLLLDDGRVQCWGADTYGQLGSAGPASDVPLDVDGLTDAVELAVGHHHACALRESREVMCWGRNHFGQLGAPGPSRSTPFPVAWAAQP